ncbi:hypothetical protein FSP39_024925 [Pinctada imbricata]|uniref:Tudor domain-containing protein n=1 Tax=Pinctada imbricata TaxID=66713 RepID=A0AA88XMZ8_PINIB|nr:hypothetical protein FSP39_024925 [Pinctada imbricata]
MKMEEAEEDNIEDIEEGKDLTSSDVEDTVIGYISWLAQTEDNKMIKLAGLTLVQEFLKKDCSDGRLKVKLLQNGVLDGLINAFDMGAHDIGDLVFLDVAMKCLFHFSKLSISPLQPMISDNILRRLLLLMDTSQNFFQFSYTMKQTCKEFCEEKHLIGKVKSVKMNADRWEHVHKMSKNSLLGRKDLPDSIHFCSLYDTDEEEQDVCEILIERGLAWPASEDVKHSDTTDEDADEESFEDIVVTRFVNGPVFWARIGIDAIQNAHDIQAFLRSEYLENKLTSCKAKKDNSVVVRRMMEDSIHFYRARVTVVDHMTAKVWLMDYGYEVTVGQESLFSLPDDVSFDVYPPQIVLCCLKGIQDPPLCCDSVRTAVVILNNLCHKSMPADTEVEFRSDVSHELRPNKTISKVSAAIVSEHVCGMLNTGKGGVIYFGISTDGFVQGIPLTRDEKD